MSNHPKNTLFILLRSTFLGLLLPLLVLSNSYGQTRNKQNPKFGYKKVFENSIFQTNKLIEAQNLQLVKREKSTMSEQKRAG